MYTQFFGSYLLRENVVTPEQLTDAIEKLASSHIKLGTLAMHKGFMTATEVDEVCFLQTREDKRFGEIAIDRNYLTEEQVTELLTSQTPDFLLLGQTLKDDGIISNTDFERLIVDYQSENEIYDLEMNIEHQDKIKTLIEKFLLISERPITEYNVMYINLVFNNLIRFIGADFTPLSPIPCGEYPTNYCVRQDVNGEVHCCSRIDMAKDVAIAFASRYAKDEFQEFDEYVQASLEDFLNLHNGLFVVNMSNQHSIELTLAPPMVETEDILNLSTDTFVIPIIYPFGTLHLIISL